MDYMIGDIILFAGNYVPANFLPCDGTKRRVQDYQALASITMSTYGGDGTNFNLPNIPNLGHARYLICSQGLYPVRE